jgi:pyruvate/2-oxoglutarate dehydrogenase complex dihydrolipoamide acyltransferase (E2) component
VAFSLWHAAAGDRVTEGDRVAELLLPGAVFDVPAPATGVLAERAAQPGDALSAGHVIGFVEEELTTEAQRHREDRRE